MTEVPEYLSYVFHEPTTLSSEEKGYPRKALPSTMPVKLFAHTNETESKQVMALLEDAEIDYELIEPDTTLMGYDVMFSVTGTKKPPVLCVDGKAYRRLSGVQDFFATR
tara:strand:- start:2462 stop:2788 length:327 start_codon:yes stop_codon:yes gene_type:complete